MSAGRDVERLIATWLVEESPGRAPDRILESAAHTIDRTKQRRFAAAWREPVSISMRGLAAIAAVLVIAIIGAGWVGRSTANVGAQPTPGPTEAASPSPDAGAELVAYRSARDLICLAAWPDRRATDARVGEGLYDPNVSAAERADKIDAIDEQADDIEAWVNELDGLNVPVAMVADEAASIARLRDTVEVIRQVVVYLRAGDLASAEAADNAIGPLSAGIQAFEQKYGLEPCP